MDLPPKPDELYARDWEWGALARFATDSSPGATLGIVSGRRRQGKSLLLEAMCRATGGLYAMATEATEAEALRTLGAAVADHLGSPGPIALAGWDHAVDVLLGLGEAGPKLVVLDEFPYLAQAAKALPSVVQRALGPSRPERLRSQTRLVLCGSAMAFMGSLLSGSAPLRGRAGMELRVQPFPYRTAAAFWGIDDPALALRVHAVVGGTPAYRKEFTRGDAPADLSDFDDWVCRTALDPASPLFREGRYLLAQESEIRDPSLYHSVLAAIADGRTTRGAIADYIGRPADTLRHPFTVLEDIGLVVRQPDLLRSGRSTYRIEEPMIGFHHAVIRPELARLEHPGRAAVVWAAAQARWKANVLGPHFEELCRTWSLDTGGASFGADLARVGPAVVNDAGNRRSIEIDVVGFDVDNRLRVLGEAKLGEVMGLRHLDRLTRARDLVAGGGRDVGETRLACFSGAGFDADLLAAADRGEAVLVDLRQIYAG